MLEERWFIAVLMLEDGNMHFAAGKEALGSDPYWNALYHSHHLRLFFMVSRIRVPLLRLLFMVLRARRDGNPFVPLPAIGEPATLNADGKI